MRTVLANIGKIDDERKIFMLSRLRRAPNSMEFWESLQFSAAHCVFRGAHALYALVERRMVEKCLPSVCLISSGSFLGNGMEGRLLVIEFASVRKRLWTGTNAVTATAKTVEKQAETSQNNGQEQRPRRRLRQRRGQTAHRRAGKSRLGDFNAECRGEKRSWLCFGERRGFVFVFALALAGGLLGKPAKAQELFTESVDLAAVEVDRIYMKGLAYLNRSQQENGTWPGSHYGSAPGVVGLAMVSMLAHGDDPNHGPFSKSIRRSLNYILESQNSKSGYIGNSMYNHGFATLALAEAYGAVEDKRLGPALTQAVRLITDSQSRNPLGAWRYSPESKDADTTISGAQMVSLFAARNAGIGVPEEAIQKGLQFFRRCQTREGGYGYTSDSGPNGPRTAIGTLVLALAKEKDSDAFRRAFAYLRQAPRSGSYYHYFLYYASQAFFHADPKEWSQWNRKNIAELSKSQNDDGSWDGQFGSAFCTAASLLSLALNYRYLPIYER